MTGKRILMVLEVDFPPDVRVQKEAHSLMKAGYEVHVCCFNFSGRRTDEILDGIHIHRLNMPREWFRKLPVLMNVIPVYAWIWQAFLNRIMNRISFNVIHVHDLPLCGAGLKLAEKHGIPLIADMHENYPYLIKDQPFMKNRLIRRLVNFRKWKRQEIKWLSSATFVITTCRGMKDRLAASGIDASKIVILENTISIAGTGIPGIDREKHDGVILVYIGGLSEDRGLQYAIEGFHLLDPENSGIRFWIIGDGSYRKYLERIVGDKKIGGIEFFGWKSRTETITFLRYADICLIPHVKSVQTDNTSPNKLFEYFFYGKPVLVTNCDYLTDIINASGTGAVYEYNSPRGFADTLTGLLQQDLFQLGERGQQLVVGKYNWEMTEITLLDLYRNV